MHGDLLHMTQMIYAGLSARDGKIKQNPDAKPDSDIFKKAFDLATGGVTEHGGSKVFKPYGMADDVFNQKLNNAIVNAAGGAGLDYRDIDDSPLLPVIGGSEGQYYISNGAGGAVMNPKTKRPLLIEVKK